MIVDFGVEILEKKDEVLSKIWNMREDIVNTTPIPGPVGTLK